MTSRNDALMNGGLIAVGALAIIDNVVAHWVIGLHRAVPGAWTTTTEAGLLVLGFVLLAVGLGREWRARRR
jgi:uncharacterized membrane protein